jgi:phosphoglycerate dehydrogenase-like enzyme
MMLSFTRALPETFASQQNHLWQPLSYEELYGKTLAIVGLGSIGREVAKRAKNMGMQVLASKRTLSQELFIDQLYTPDQLPHMLSLADFVAVTVPLTPQTQGMFNSQTFPMMKKTAYFINVSRGAVVDETALIQALNDGTIKGAALDVFDREPLPADSPLYGAPNLIITPHIAAMSPYYMGRALKVFAENLTKFCLNSEMLNIVDKKTGY